MRWRERCPLANQWRRSRSASIFCFLNMGKKASKTTHRFKEVAEISFAMKHLQLYLAGCHKTVYTDHMPLLRIMSQADPIPLMLSIRIIWWYLVLGCYDYKLHYRFGKISKRHSQPTPVPKWTWWAAAPGRHLISRSNTSSSAHGPPSSTAHRGRLGSFSSS